MSKLPYRLYAWADGAEPPAQPVATGPQLTLLLRRQQLTPDSPMLWVVIHPTRACICACRCRASRRQWQAHQRQLKRQLRRPLEQPSPPHASGCACDRCLLEANADQPAAVALANVIWRTRRRPPIGDAAHYADRAAIAAELDRYLDAVQVAVRPRGPNGVGCIGDLAAFLEHWHAARNAVRRVRRDAAAALARLQQPDAAEPGAQTKIGLPT